MLFQLQESRKAIEIHKDDDVIFKVKETFGLDVETGVILQAYEEEWSEWCDVSVEHHMTCVGATQNDASDYWICSVCDYN